MDGHARLSGRYRLQRLTRSGPPCGGIDPKTEGHGQFGGGGSIDSMISFEPPRVWEPGELCQVYTNKFQAGHRQVRFLDESTLRPVGEPVRLYPADFETPSVKAATQWQVNIRGADISTVKRDGKGWVLRWESASPNRDQARDVIPQPSRLEVVVLASP